MKRFIYCLLISLTFLMSQEPCEGTCLSEEETINITNGLKELEFKDSTNTLIISNLNGQVKLYMEQHANDSLLIDLNKTKSILLNDRIDLYNELIKDQMPLPNKGLISAYKDIIPTIIKQAYDPSFVPDRKIPKII